MTEVSRSVKVKLKWKVRQKIISHYEIILNTLEIINNLTVLIVTLKMNRIVIDFIIIKKTYLYHLINIISVLIWNPVIDKNNIIVWMEHSLVFSKA